MVRVLITGISGFVGRHLAQHCAERGDVIFGVARRAIGDSESLGMARVLQADLRDRTATRSALQASRPDVVYHLAAQSNVPEAWADPAATITNNIAAEANLLQSLVDMDHRGAIVVSAGSSECYGRIQPEDNPIRESTPLRPVNPYGVSKAAQDLLGYQYFASHGLHIVRMRPFNHIGPGQSDAFVVPAFAKQIAEIELGRREAIMVVGNLDAIRDFTDVRDIVEGYRLAAERAIPGEAYNVGSGAGIAIRSILDELRALSSASIRVETSEELLRPSDQPRIVCDSTKFRDATRWAPIIPLRDSLQDVLAWWREKLAVGAYP